MKPETKRLIAAVFIAPLALGFVWGVIALALVNEAPMAFPGYAIISFVFALLIGLVVGLPTHFALKKKRRTTLAYYLFAAGLIGSVPAFIPLFFYFDNPAERWGAIGVIAAVFFPSALFTAGVAWAIARPDKSEATTGAP